MVDGAGVSSVVGFGTGVLAGHVPHVFMHFLLFS